MTGVEVRVDALPGANADEVDEILAVGMDALEQLSNLLGPYPYAQLSYVDVGPHMPGGVEFPNLIYINGRLRSARPVDLPRDVASVDVRDIGNRTLLDGWIDEGGAEFFERGLPTISGEPDHPDGGYLYPLDSTYLELPTTPPGQWYYSIYEQGARF